MHECEHEWDSEFICAICDKGVIAAYEEARTEREQYQRMWQEYRENLVILQSAVETAGAKLGHVEAERDELRALLEAHHDADDGPCFVCTAAPTAEQVQYAKSWGYDL